MPFHVAAAGLFRQRGFHQQEQPLVTLATEARTVVAGRVASGSGGNDVLTMRLVPSAEGSAVLTENGVLHLPGFRLELAPAGPAGNGRR